MLRSLRFNPTLSKVLQVIVLIYQGMAVLAVLAALYFGNVWLKQPFIGAFFENTLVMNGTKPGQPSDAWQLANQGVQLGDQLVFIEDVEVHTAEEIRRELGRFHPGETIQVEIRAENGEMKSYSVLLHKFPAEDRNKYYVIPFVVAAAFLVISLWIFGLRRTEPAGRAFTLFASSLAIVSGTLFDLFTTHRFTHLWTFALATSGGAMIDLALTFPHESRIISNRPYLRWIGYFIGLALTGYSFLVLFDFDNPIAYIRAWQIIYIFDGLATVFYLGITAYFALRSLSPVVRTQARSILAGALVGLGPIAIWLLLTPWRVFAFTPILFVVAIAFPLTIGYTILRFRLLRTDLWVRQGLVYTTLAIFAVFGYAGIVSGISLIFKTAMPNDNPLLIAGMVFVLAVSLDPIRTRLLGVIDHTFFRGQRAYEQRLREFSHSLTGVLDLESIGRALRMQIMDTLAPEYIHIYTYDPLSDQYVSLPDEDGRPSSDVRFASSSPLAEYFAKEHLPLYLDSGSLPESLKLDEARLNLLGTRLFVDLPGNDSPMGWLALGQRLSGQPYTAQDLSFLENLADQASVAVGRVQTVSNLERRVQEMNALTRVSQGVNVTLSFDDVMELIFAQTGQIIPATEFHITLYNKDADYFYYAFCIENHDRLEQRENSPLPLNLGLGQDVIRKGRPILTQDYLRECQARNMQPAIKNVFAWMGVPLNAGAETIGSLSIGTRDASVTYSRAQLNLLQAIADQTAGAIVKSRLLEETQQRAHQLSTLNDLTRQLTSTLELEPLLKNILENAVSILNCEAGSLFLVDEQTGDLIFNVTVGPPSSADLIGQRIPAGNGIVGQAAQRRAPILENSAQSSSVHFVTTDQQTGFTSKSLLAVPLLFKDRVIGVIEVINRKDGLPFVEDDQTLLSAFAGQAAVAIENARLYTLTDQELAARVEELSVLQRIDRELNASLEMDRAMRITLEWAMRQSHAEAGLIGMLDEEQLHVMAEQGYGNLASLGSSIPLEMESFKVAYETSQPQQVQIRPEAQGNSLLPNVHTQIVIPIRREAVVIGLILLESTSDTQQDIDFLNRLSDHAAIAISNAQLYNEVQRANEAKSEFVSFVAHELKNPMTSIKGYTELLAGGAVGPINEMQTKFLQTIRSNVERMSTLVSDLNDNSKIEAGRLRLDFKAVAVSDVVDEVTRSNSRQIEDAGQALHVDVPNDLPSVWADSVRINQILTNLVSNAHKYTPSGGQIFIQAEESSNQWDPEGADRVVHIWVRDTGIGISAEDQQKIFQKFFRSDDQKAREAPGTGLGLNITRSLVEMQGGKIWFDSEFRKGTAFHFTIPVAEG